jgi:syntaxin 6
MEISNRRNFVTDSQLRIQNSKEGMQSSEVKDKFLRDDRAKLERRKLSNGSSTHNTRQTSKNDDLYLQEEGEADSSRSETMLMMQQQDSTLDGLSTAVTRVSAMAGTIHKEIESQNKMLTELEDDLIDAEEQLGVVMGKLGKLLKTRSRCQIGLILVLSLIVLVLFFLVLYI